MDLRWAHRRLTAEDLVVAASVSGRTPRTIEAAVLAQEAGANVLGITDNPVSPLHETLNRALVLGTTPPELLQDEFYPGYRNIIAQTQTFVAVLLVEFMLAAEMSGMKEDLERVPQRVRELVGILEDTARELAEAFFVGSRQVVVLGSGPHWPLACYGSAKMLEFAVPATAQCIEEFNHLQAFVADAGTRIIVLAADDESASRAAELVGVWEVVGARSLVLARSGEFRGDHTRVFQLPCGDLLDAALCQLIALQLLVATGVAAMGRDPNRWLGGRRTERVQSMNRQTVRGSRLWRPRH
jgi:fructoselysine-6-P-deglycase FrlB-like protein